MDPQSTPVYQPKLSYSPSVTPIEQSRYEAQVSHQTQNNPQLPDDIKLKSSSEGISSADPLLNNDANLLSLFFKSNNTSPRMWVEIIGYETVVTYTTTTGSNGQMIHNRREDKKIHFKLAYDVSQLISQAGTMHTPVPKEGPSKEGPPKKVEDVLAEHTSSSNNLKSIALKKEVVWDYEWLDQALTAAIRSRGFKYQLQISYRLENYYVKVICDHATSRFLNHPVTKVLCVLTCLCVVAWPIAYFYGRKHQRMLISDFTMNLTPQEWFNTIYDSLMKTPLQTSILSMVTNS
ncbi:hypothetical protein DSO57_1002940 [Entomophthora muscae]|uniref:Uncharacterized protein n=1 Tax=Entomophthora muscae TaxID=34485 RepID=A0ACC2T8E9_9FUNG|nr:hypothetical protein DSO57_1002940 [Entomophthora muscae]